MQFYYGLQGNPGIERKLERWKREKEESIETWCVYLGDLHINIIIGI